MEGGSGSLTVMADQSGVPTRCKQTLHQLLSGTPNKFGVLDPDGDDDKVPSDYGGEESVKVGSGKSSMDEAEVISPETESEDETTAPVPAGNMRKLAKKLKRKQKKEKAKAEAKARDEEAGKVSVTEAEEAVTKEAEEGALLVRMDSTGGESSMHKVSEEESGQRSEMQRHTEEPMPPVPSYWAHLSPESWEKYVKHNRAREAKWRELVEKISGDMGKNSAWVRSNLLGDVTASNNSAREKAGDELGKRSETMRISPEMQLHAEVRRALFDIQQKLAKKKSRKMDKETLRLLTDMSDMLDQCGDDDDEKDHDSGISAVPLVKKTAAEKEMADEAKRFAFHRENWEYKHGKTCGFFDDITVLSSMQFTHYMPGRRIYSLDGTSVKTLQIISIKLTRLAGGLELPLSVYGVVAVRDMVDRNQNILFFCDRSKAQELKQNDPFLHLIGPSRAIVMAGKVCVEIELRVKGGAYSQDHALISCARRYTGWNGSGVSTICFENVLCTLELCLEPVKQTVQATILGVQVAKHDGSWPFKYGGLVACTPLSGEYVFSDSGLTRRINPSSVQIVLIDSKDEAMPKGENGFADLSRQVVSVEVEGRLDFVIKAYSRSGDIADVTSVSFYPKVSNISQKKCFLGDAEVSITVAWSIVVSNKTDLSLELTGRRGA